MKLIWIMLLTSLLGLQAKDVPIKEKLVIVYVELEHCRWCHKMSKETFDNESKKSQFQEEYLLAKIKKESGDVPLFLNPKIFPTTYILSSDGSKILDELPGYMKSARLIDYLHELYQVEMGIEEEDEEE